MQLLRHIKCTLHRQWGRKPPKLLVSLGISSLRHSWTKPRRYGQHAQKFVKIVRVVQGICSRPDRHTHRRAHYNTWLPLPRSKW